MKQRDKLSAWFEAALLILITLALGASNVQAQGRMQAQRQVSGQGIYRGNIIYIGGPRGSATDFFTLKIDSITPEDEVKRMLAALQNGGQDELQKILGHQKRGTLQIGARLSHDIQAVWVTQTEEGRKIYALSERWLGFGELRRGTRSVDYPFTFVELYVEDDGKAEGELIPAARVRAKKGMTIEVENFGIYPARLTNVRQSRK